MMATRCFTLTIALLVYCQCWWRDASASCSMQKHPQREFCDADYVFQFKAMTSPGEGSQNSLYNRVGGRNKRGLVPGMVASGGFGMMKPKKQMAQVQTFYKGKEMVMPMITVIPVEEEEQVSDSFSPGEASLPPMMETSMQLGMYEKPLKKNDVYVYFGRMFRHRDNTMKPLKDQIMFVQCGNTMVRAKMTKVMKRGIRKKYAQGCKTGCQVKTFYGDISSKKLSKKYCYWNPIAYGRSKTDCRKTSQYCQMGKKGFCEWKKTKLYYNCLAQNKLP